MKVIVTLSFYLFLVVQAHSQLTTQPDSLFVVTYTLGQSWDASRPPHEQTNFKEHSAHLSRLRKEGIIKIGARFADKGFLVITAPSLQTAKDIVHQDVAVVNRLFQVDVQKFEPFYYGSIEKPYVKPPAVENPWKFMEYFIGAWKGSGEGESGKGEYNRTYAWSLNKSFIKVQNRSSYAPQPKNEKGEVHEDNGYISFDKRDQKFVLRQFHIEGFVNQYRQESNIADTKTIIFTSFAIENIPPGWRARETWQIINDNEFTETFELAPPGKEFSVYSKATLHRVKK